METLLSAVVTFVCIFQVSGQTEDFRFEQENGPMGTLPPLKRLWGIPDSTGQVGTLLRITVPSDAFEGVVTKYEVSFSSYKKSCS